MVCDQHETATSAHPLFDGSDLGGSECGWCRKAPVELFLSRKGIGYDEEVDPTERFGREGLGEPTYAIAIVVQEVGE